MNQTNTAHLEWEKKWQTEEGREAWLEAESDVIEVLPLLKEREVKDVLDLGCGVGRHSLLLAEQGFQVRAMDGSESGLAFLEKEADKRGISLETKLAEMTQLPYADSSFDYILAWNVIYHGNLSVVTRVISEITRILKPGALFQGTMLSKRNFEVNSGHQLSYNTFINQGMSDKNHPHFYVNSTELVSLFTGYEFWSMVDKEHTRPGSNHWHLLVEKL